MSGFVGTTKYNYRRLNGLGFIVCASAIAFTTAYLQEQLALEPCILCSLTQLITLSVASIFLLAYLHNPGSTGQRLYGVVGFFMTLAGIATTLKHVWIHQQLIDSSTGTAVTASVIQLTATTSDVDIEEMISVVDHIYSKMTDAASNLGAVNKRIEMQNDFVGNLMDSIDKGVGRLVDADMNEESTRLKALQTQQQLGVQALSIANSSSQNIMSLFR